MNPLRCHESYCSKKDSDGRSFNLSGENGLVETFSTAPMISDFLISEIWENKTKPYGFWCDFSKNKTGEHLEILRLKVLAAIPIGLALCDS